MSCKFGGLSKIWDSYDEIIRQWLLTSGTKHDVVSNINFQWVE